MIKIIPMLNIVISTFLNFILCTPLDEVASIEITKGKFIIEVIILKQ